MNDNTENRNMKNSILKYFGQIFLIVFSVVLGLYLSERIEEKKNKRDAQQIFLTIHSELNTNKQILDYWTPYHKEIVDNLDSLSSDKSFIETFINDRSEIYSAFSKGTIMGDLPSNTAWDIAKSHPLIVNMDYDQLFILSKLYDQQEITYSSMPELIDLMLSTEFNSKGQAYQNIQLFNNKLKEIHSREVQLINYYEQAEK